MLSFIAYYKRDAIINRITVFYENNFQKNTREENISVLNPEPYKTEIGFINNDNHGKTIKIAILGNSISLHGIVKGLWEHESGMAASDLEHDYVHVLLNKISKEKGCGIEYIVINISDFERGFNNFTMDRLEEVKRFSPEIIIFQIGENVSKEDITKNGKQFEQKYIELIEYFESGKKIICIPFWPSKEKIEIITEVAIRGGVYLVDLSHLGSGIQPLNLAKSENKYNHTGVAAHPGDYGMENIAKTIYITLEKLIE
jgi:hypothetical protein